MARYCPDCGDSHECAAQIDRQDDATAIELAKISANRDIRVAEVQAGTDQAAVTAAVEIAESEAEQDAARAEGHAAGMDRVLDDIAGGGPEGQAPEDGEPLPVLELAGGPPEDAEPVMAPPDTPLPPREKKRSGFWDNYG